VSDAPDPSRNHGSPGGRGERPDFHVVALGASAGGLDSLGRFFERLAPRPHAAFVVLMHLAPHRTSNLVHILSEYTEMPVEEIRDGAPLRPGRIHVPPPGTRLTLESGRFRVEERSEPTEHVIDILFSSLAEGWSELGIGIVLSGSGSDGSRGISALRGVGAFTLAEDPSGASFGDMPQNAIRTGQVDVVGSPAELAGEVVRFVSFGTEPPEAETEELEIGRVLEVIRRRREPDFDSYKENTIRRRIGRRIRLRHVGSVDEYVQLIREDDEELDALVRDLLITVTQFFRDQAAFEELAATAIPEILDRKEKGSTVRIWVPGCSTGEEAYTLTFLFLQQMRARGLSMDLQVFGTDLDEVGLETARAGIYPAGVAADVPGEILRRYFRAEDDTLRVNKVVRQKIIFSVHDVIHDPPFAHMDLVSCRNLLIYLVPEAQKRVLSYLHYALEPEGYLLLGSSESILGARNLFQPVAANERIFRKVPGGLPPDFRFPTSLTGLEVQGRAPETKASGRRQPSLSRLAERALLKVYGPPGVLVDLEHEVVYYLGDTSPYLKPPPGAPNRDVTRLVRPELHLGVRRVLEQVETERDVVTTRPLELETRRGRETIRIVGYPVDGLDDELSYVLVVFEGEEGGGAHARPREISEEERTVVEQLETELRYAKDELRATAEHKDAVNEELRSANEELISMNEELQSTNEELETAKEELQSMNEELETVNAELGKKIDELARANANMENLLASTQIATIFLDRSLCIKSYTRPATEIFSIIPSDRGRPLSDIATSLDVEGLGARMERVLESLEPVEETVRDESGRAYAMRILPYRTEEEVVDGVVLAFVDVTDLKEAEAEARRLGAVVRASRDAVTIVDEDGVIVSWNRGATETYGYQQETAVGMKMRRLVPEEEREAFDELLERALTGRAPSGFEARRLHRDGTELVVLTTLTVLREAEGTKLAFTERDITERKKVERHRELLLRELDHRVKNTIATVQAITERTIVNSGHSMDDFAEAFRGRIQALGRVHKALSDQKWVGVHVDQLVSRTLTPHGKQEQIHLEGEDVVLPVRVTLPLAMALHELVTNAVKYGALAAPDGRVVVSWDVDPDRSLRIEWREEDGPPVTPPEEEGFGMTLLKRGIAYEVGGSTEVSFEEDGVRCTMELPLGDTRNGS